MSTPTARSRTSSPSSRTVTSGCTSRASVRTVPTRRCTSSRAAKGRYVWDVTGHRLLDGLSGLFTVQVGHGRAELAEAARAQAETLEYFPIWTYAHPPAIELAARLAELAPGDLNRVFFTIGRVRGGRVGVEARPPVLPRHRPGPAPQGDRARAPRTTARRSVPSRSPASPRCARRSSRSRPARSTSPTPTAAATRSATTRRRSCSRSPTRSRIGSSSRAPRRWPRSSSSRCRTPAGASCRPRATSRACARSATGTACCSCPTR